MNKEDSRKSQKASIVSAVAHILMQEEGLRLEPYRCPAGKLTIGFGHNLDDRPITMETAKYMLFEDVFVDTELVEDLVGDLSDLPQVVVVILIAMSFQLGFAGLLGFKKMLAKVKLRDWKGMRAEMLDSKWARVDSPERAARMVKFLDENLPSLEVN